MAARPLPTASTWRWIAPDECKARSKPRSVCSPFASLPSRLVIPKRGTFLSQELLTPPRLTVKHTNSMIVLTTLAAVALLPLLVLGQIATLSSYAALPTIVGNGSAVRPDGKYVISSEGITGYFIPYGASISNLFIQDVHGVERDIVLGYAGSWTYSRGDVLCGAKGGVGSIMLRTIRSRDCIRI